MASDNLKTRLMAIACAVCPFCITARKWPQSAYAKKLRELEKNCPFCRAYRRLKAGRPNNERASDG